MRTQWALLLQLIRWDRPAGWLLLLWPTLSALWLAAGGFPGWHLLTVFVLGTILMRSAGCCINDVADRKFDHAVARTAQRPVTTGRVSVRLAVTVAAVLALLAFALVLTTNKGTVMWSFFALAITLIYPYSKRFFSLPQAVLGVAFSLGIPMAYAAVLGHAPITAWLFLLANLWWVVAYDTEYAMVDREDDLRIGIKTSAITFGQHEVLIVILCYGVHFLMLGGLALAQQVSWPFYLALCAAGLQTTWHYRLIRKRNRADCFTAFRLNHWLGFTLFVGWALSV